MSSSSSASPVGEGETRPRPLPPPPTSSSSPSGGGNMSSSSPVGEGERLRPPPPPPPSSSSSPSGGESPPNFFTGLTTFPAVTEEGKVDTTQFLEAAKAFIQIYDLLGAAFYVVKKDMSGNIEKLYKTYNKSPEKYVYLNDLISEERGDPSVFAVDALLWLKRALEFTIVFINGICDAYEKGTDFDRLDQIATDAYNTTLKKYHMWLVQNVFKVVVKSVPTRSGLVKALYFGKTGPEAALFRDSRTYTQRLEKNIAVIIRMYDVWGLDSDKKV